MSIESISIALHHSRATGAAKLVLIGIANHDGDGGAWPSVATLAKYAGVDRRSVQRSIARLEELHEIRRFVQAGGDHRVAEHERPNRYNFLLSCPPDCDRTSRHRTSRAASVELDIDPATPASPPDAGVAPPPDAGVAQTILSTIPRATEKERPVPEHASEHGACGHQLIDDRHCERGCTAARVQGDAA